MKKSTRYGDGIFVKRLGKYIDLKTKYKYNAIPKMSIEPGIYVDSSHLTPINIYFNMLYSEGMLEDNSISVDEYIRTFTPRR